MNGKYINSWIEIAIKDLEVSELLYKNKMYSNSFYHFQQASEKSLKAYLFLNNTFKKEKDAKNVSHFMLEPFKKSIKENQENISKGIELGLDVLFDNSLINSYTEDLKKSLDFLPKKNEVYEYSGKILEQILTILEEFKTYKIKFQEIPVNVVKEKINSWFDNFSKFNPIELEVVRHQFNVFIDSEEQYINFLTNYKNETQRNLKEYYFVLILYYSNLISHNHNNLTRYPDSEFNPLKYYNLKRPLIKKLPEFIKLLKSSLIHLKRLNSL